MVNNLRKRSLFVLMMCIVWLAILPSIPLFVQCVTFNGEHYNRAISIYSLLLCGTGIFVPDFQVDTMTSVANRLLFESNAQAIVNWAMVYGLAVIVVLVRASYSVVFCRYNCMRNVEGLNGYKLFELRNKLIKNTSALVISLCYYMSLMYFVFAWVVSGQCGDSFSANTFVSLNGVELDYILLGYVAILPVIVCHVFVAKYAKVIFAKKDHKLTQKIK